MILIGVSACLLGEQVRYDGGHKRNAFLLEDLAPHVRFVPVCPEVGVGLGVPREAIRLVRSGDRIRLVGSAGIDHTDAVRRWAAATIVELRRRDLSGSCSKGLPELRPRARPCAGRALRAAVAAGARRFAQAVVDALPTLAIEEEGRLHDPGLREHFVNRIFGHARDRDFFAASWTAAQLIRFHSAEKVAVLAHDAETARRLGRLVARQGELEPEVLAQLYRELHAAGLARPSSPGKQANALMHLVPVTVPLALLGGHLRAVGAEWAYSQAYLRPYPKQLGLRGVIARTPKGRGATPA